MQNSRSLKEAFDLRDSASQELIFLLLTGHCCIQWLDSLPQSEGFLFFVYSIRVYAFRLDFYKANAETNILWLATWLKINWLNIN